MLKENDIVRVKGTVNTTGIVKFRSVYSVGAYVDIRLDHNRELRKFLETDVEKIGELATEE